MQCTNLEAKAMSFDFGSNNINQIKAQATYKDGGGLGGGGMYMKQNKKRKDEPEDPFQQIRKLVQNPKRLRTALLVENFVPKF